MTECAIVNGARVGSNYKVISANGIVLMNGVIDGDNHTIDMNDMSKGFYFVRIDGAQKKIIKQ